MSDELKNKIINFEVTPPAHAWSNIASALMEQQEYLPLSARMYDVEIPPPEDAWSTISAELRKKNTTPVRQIKRDVVRLAAAAAFLGVIITGSIFFFQRSATDTAGIDGPKRHLRPAKILQNTAAAARASIADFVQPPTAGILYATNQPYKLRRLNAGGELEKRMLRNTDVREDFPDEQPNISVKASPIRNESGEIIQNTELIHSNGDEYISVTGPNGQQTRISSKFVHALMYLNGEGNRINDADASYYESAAWQKKFQDWRDKIMQTSYIPSSTNFLDILEFKDMLLKDNQQ